MLRVTVQIIPHGDESLARVIDQIDITNDLSHPDRPNQGNYRVTSLGLPPGNVFNHYRNLGIWPLLHKVAAERFGQDQIKKAQPVIPAEPG